MKRILLLALAGLVLSAGESFAKAKTKKAKREHTRQIIEKHKEKKMKNAYTVICIVEAKKGKEDELKQALEAVVEPSRSESTNLEYRLHQDVNNPAQFVLYENWTSQEDHKKQFDKQYIIDLMEKTEDILEKPYMAVFAQEVR